MNTGLNKTSLIHPRYWSSYLVIGLLRLISLLPYSLVRVLGRGIGSLALRVGGKRKAIAETNLQLCFPELNAEQRAHLLKQNFQSTATGFLELAYTWYASRKKIVTLCDSIEGIEHYEKAKQRGNGVILLAFHLTSLELGGTIFAQQNKLAAMYRPSPHPVMERAMARGRARHVKPIPRDEVRTVVKWLKSGGTVWYGSDQDYGSQHSVFVPFFNINTATITATSRFVKMTGATVVPFTHYRTDDNKLKLQLHPAWTDMGKDERADAARVNRFLETYLTQHPEDYLWFHRRFKTRPAGEPSLYQDEQRDTISAKRLETICQRLKLVAGSEERPLLLSESDRSFYYLFYKNGDGLFANYSDAHKFLSFLQQQNICQAKFVRVMHCAEKRCSLAVLETPPPLLDVQSATPEQQQKLLARLDDNHLEIRPDNNAPLIMSTDEQTHLPLFGRAHPADALTLLRPDLVSHAQTPNALQEVNLKIMRDQLPVMYPTNHKTPRPVVSGTQGKH